MRKQGQNYWELASAYALAVAAGALAAGYAPSGYPQGAGLFIAVCSFYKAAHAFYYAAEMDMLSLRWHLRLVKRGSTVTLRDDKGVK